MGDLAKACLDSGGLPSCCVRLRSSGSSDFSHWGQAQFESQSCLNIIPRQVLAAKPEGSMGHLHLRKLVCPVCQGWFHFSMACCICMLGVGSIIQGLALDWAMHIHAPLSQQKRLFQSSSNTLSLSWHEVVVICCYHGGHILPPWPALAWRLSPPPETPAPLPDSSSQCHSVSCLQML